MDSTGDVGPRAGRLKMDRDARRVFVDGDDVGLTALEFDLLDRLAVSPGRVCTKAQLAEHLWGYDPGYAGAISVHIANVRRKLSAQASDPIRTVRGRGYLLDATCLDEGERSAAHPDAFVGRSKELDELRAALVAARAGEPTFVLVSGEAGIGKTRLAERFVEDARIDGIVVAWGRCDPDAAAQAFWPWSQALRSLLDTVPPSTARDLRARSPLVDILAPPAAGETPRVIERGPPKPGPERLSLFDSVASVLQGSGAHSPVTLVIDDLHWADESSMDLLAFLVRHMHSARVLVLGLYRDAQASLQPPFLEALSRMTTERRCSRIAVTGLAGSEVAELLGSFAALTRVKELAPAVAQLTSGNPLFVREVGRSLALAHGHGATSEDIPTDLSLARELGQAVSAHLSELSPDALDLISRAAVLGLEFAEPPLESASGLDPGRFGSLLCEAKSLQVITPLDCPARWRFTHPLVRQVLYDGLDPALRAVWHGEMGSALESLGDSHPSSPVEKAHHFAEAATAGHGKKAAEWALQAAADAVGRSGHAEAIALLDRGLEALDAQMPPVDDDSLRRHLLEDAGDACLAAGRHDEAAARHAQALERLRRSDPVQRARLLRKIARVEMERRRWSESETASIRAEEALACSDRDNGWWGEWIEGRLQRLEFAYYGAPVPPPEDDGELSLEDAIAEHGTPPQRARHLWCRVLDSFREGRHSATARARSVTSEHRRAALALGSPAASAYAEAAVGSVLLWSGEHLAAERHLLEGLRLSDLAHDPTARSYSLGNLAVLCRMRGDVDKTREWSTLLQELAAEPEQTEHQGGTVGNLAWVALRSGDAAEAEELAEGSLAILARIPGFPFRWLAAFPLLACKLDDSQGKAGEPDAHALGQTALDRCVTLTREMLDETQQLLDPAVTELLERAVAAADASEATDVLSALRSAVREGRRLGYT